MHHEKISGIQQEFERKFEIRKKKIERFLKYIYLSLFGKVI